MKARKSIAKKTLAAPVRQRNAAGTRQAILVSARTAFARSGYDGVGVREIARAAGVTAILVNRYFGSKEQLFSEVVDSAMATPGILNSETLARKGADLSRGIASALVAKTAPEAAQLDGFLILLRSASNERAAAIWREKIEQHFESSLTTRLKGHHAKERAGLILALIAGFQIMRQAVATPSLSDADPAWLMRELTGLIQVVVDHRRPRL